MTKEQKQTFTLRITNANKSEMMVILCDIFLCYAEETKELLLKWKAFTSATEGVKLEDIEDLEVKIKDSMRHLRASLREMIAVLPGEDSFGNADDATNLAEKNNKSDLSKEVLELSQRILALYRYVERELISASVKRNEDAIENAIQIVRKLNQAFIEISKKDQSSAIMQNTEKIYAGMTYGRNSIQESSTVQGNRGFWA